MKQIFLAYAAEITPYRAPTNPVINILVDAWTLDSANALSDELQAYFRGIPSLLKEIIPNNRRVFDISTNTSIGQKPHLKT